ncbi:MAG: tRNA (N(6)-L-threonylcarbamoyladenosine(37)-C(2))-methylthiotransferase MtaB [Coriobacteriales bacterium]|nr:tRNA (N(6)-L-threonylcarbamoyladenosine(37)-C(2))-methylthiotransferase MtaB [Coriobacteriales bacterium]
MNNTCEYDCEKPSCSVVNLGCRVNRVECDWFETQLRDTGIVVAEPEQSQVIIINSCIVTGEAQAKTRKSVRHMASLPQRPQVIVTGCAAVLFQAELEAICDRVHVVSQKELVVQEAINTLSFFDNESEQPMYHSGSGESTFLRSIDRVKRGVKIQDGCDNCCSYCIVWKARGASRSVPLQDVLNQVKRVMDEGALEVTLTGINLGKYDAGDGSETLATLIDAVCECGAKQIRLSSIEPCEVTPSVIDAMVRHKDRVCPYLHIPLQAGSNEILRQMGRHYTCEEYYALVEELRKSMPHISISTDLMVGFPGETEEQFRETLEFCKAVGFSKIHAFKYSPRPGTPAAAMPNQIDATVKQERSKRLRELAAQLRYDDAAKRLGTVENILVESFSLNGTAQGKTASFHSVQIPGDAHNLTSCTLIPCILKSVNSQQVITATPAL